MGKKKDNTKTIMRETSMVPKQQTQKPKPLSAAKNIIQIQPHIFPAPPPNIVTPPPYFCTPTVSGTTSFIPQSISTYMIPVPIFIGQIHHSGHSFQSMPQFAPFLAHPSMGIPSPPSGSQPPPLLQQMPMPFPLLNIPYPPPIGVYLPNAGISYRASTSSSVKVEEIKAQILADAGENSDDCQQSEVIESTETQEQHDKENETQTPDSQNNESKSNSLIDMIEALRGRLSELNVPLIAIINNYQEVMEKMANAKAANKIQLGVLELEQLLMDTTCKEYTKLRNAFSQLFKSIQKKMEFNGNSQNSPGKSLAASIFGEGNLTDISDLLERARDELLIREKSHRNIISECEHFTSDLVQFQIHLIPISVLDIRPSIRALRPLIHWMQQELLEFKRSLGDLCRGLVEKGWLLLM